MRHQTESDSGGEKRQWRRSPVVTDGRLLVAIQRDRAEARDVDLNRARLLLLVMRLRHQIHFEPERFDRTGFPERSGLELLGSRCCIGLFADVQHRFLELADAAEGIERYTITTAVPLTDDLRGAVRQRLERDGRQVVMTEQVNPDIIGGLMIRHNDLIQDFSVRGQLEVLREQLAAGS